MKTPLLLKYLLPSELSEYFELVDLQESADNTLCFYLDEKNEKPAELASCDLVSHGFSSSVTIQDFPLRDKRVYLIVRRHKWKDKRTGKIHMRKWDLTAEGTSYSKEFAAFLKELHGYFPY